MKLNNCGVCSSHDAMCEYYSKSYSAEEVKLNKYKQYANCFNVATIPKGAVRVEIVQFGHHGDGNYIGKTYDTCNGYK